MKKNLTNILLVILIVITVGLYFRSPIVRNTIQQLAGAVGDTNSTSAIYQSSISLATTTPLSTTNSSGRDRLITSVEYYVASSSQALSNATGLASLTWLLSTSTDIYTAASVNYVLNTTIGTTTSLYVATTTPGNSAVATTSRVWANGSNLNLFQNGTSTASGVYLIIRYLVL